MKNAEVKTIREVQMWCFAVSLLVAGGVSAQSTTQVAPSTMATVPQLSLQAAYDEAERPVDIVHRAIGNWSEVEQAALGVAVGKAAAACAARDPYGYKGEDLLADARLCSFAQMWEQVQQAAMGYMGDENRASPEERRTGFPNLALAFDYAVQASLQLKNTTNAFGTAQTMLRTVAYDDLVSEATNGVVRYVQLVQTDEALALLVQRQPQLVTMLRARGVAADSGVKEGAGASGGLLPSARPPMTMHDVYADAIMLPAMQQFARMPEAAAASYAELEAALPQNLSADDAILIGTLRRQYKLLGARLPSIAASAALLDSAAVKAPDVNRKNAGAEAFLLFPDWCAQCVGMNPLFNEASKALKAEGVVFYALLAQANPVAHMRKALTRPRGPVSDARAPSASSTAAEQLMGTATLVVPTQTIDMFAATDFPLLVVTDGCGLVRYIGVAPENALVEGGLIYQVEERVKREWPVATFRTMETGVMVEERRCGVAGPTHP
ncbi:MAG TPA: hypothetical protein VGU46_05450 [Acidobacteriaceae bacterium]|nr:hypothetical protein [Acidobacteriaceae bacterium]